MTTSNNCCRCSSLHTATGITRECDQRIAFMLCLPLVAQWIDAVCSRAVINGCCILYTAGQLARLLAVCQAGHNLNQAKQQLQGAHLSPAGRHMLLETVLRVPALASLITGYIEVHFAVAAFNGTAPEHSFLQLTDLQVSHGPYLYCCHSQPSSKLLATVIITCLIAPWCLCRLWILDLAAHTSHCIRLHQRCLPPSVAAAVMFNTRPVSQKFWTTNLCHLHVVQVGLEYETSALGLPVMSVPLLLAWLSVTPQQHPLRLLNGQAYTLTTCPPCSTGKCWLLSFDESYLFFCIRIYMHRSSIQFAKITLAH